MHAVIETVGVGGEFLIWPGGVVRGWANLPTRRWRSPYTEGRVSLHGGFEFPTRRVWVSYVGVAVSLRGGLRLPTWRVWVPYVEDLGFLRGVSGGAVGVGGFVVGDGAAT